MCRCIFVKVQYWLQNPGLAVICMGGFRGDGWAGVTLLGGAGVGWFQQSGTIGVVTA